MAPTEPTDNDPTDADKATVPDVIAEAASSLRARLRMERLARRRAEIGRSIRD